MAFSLPIGVHLFCERGEEEEGAVILQEEHSLHDDITETSKSEESKAYLYLSKIHVSLLDESEKASEFGHLVFPLGARRSASIALGTWE